MNGKLVIWVGGGYMIIEEFISTYAQAELLKLEQLAKWEGVQSFMELDLEYYALGTQGGGRNSVGSPKGAALAGGNSPMSGWASTTGTSNINGTNRPKTLTIN